MKYIVGLTFPQQNLKLGLEPSLLTVLPDDTEEVKCKYFLNEKDIDIPDEDVLCYACSVYITGVRDFISFCKKIGNKEKIVCGGYEPTCSTEKFKPYASKIIVGTCNQFFETLAQDGQVVKGITKWNRIPRYDLWDIKLNQQIIPDKMPSDLVTSVNTSQGCPFKCNFCCSPLICDHLVRKPIELLRREISCLQKMHPKFIFIRDENFPLCSDWRERLAEISKLGAKIYMFGSSNLLLNEGDIAYMKSCGTYMVCLGLEDVTESYAKNGQLDRSCSLLHNHGIGVYLSFIVNPLKIKTESSSSEFYSKLHARFTDLAPEMVCGNFLMPFPGTKIWEDYKDIVTEDDFAHYDSKSAFLEKDLERRAKMEFDMFKHQWIYYTSSFYSSNVRKFDIGDTLHLRFLELRDEFEKKGSKL